MYLCVCEREVCACVLYMRVRASIHTCGAVRVEVIAFAVDVDLVHRPYELAHRTHVFLHLTRQEEAGDADQAWVLALLRNRLERETRKESKYLLFFAEGAYVSLAQHGESQISTKHHRSGMERAFRGASPIRV